MTDKQILRYKKLFLEPEHHDYFMQAMQSLSSKEIMEVFRSFFRKEPIESVVLLGGQPRKISDIRGHHVLEAMELRKHNPKLLENYADFWIDLNEGTLEKIEAGDFPDEVSTTILNVAHFLVHTPAGVNTDIWTNQLAAQSEQITILEQRVQIEQERNQYLEHDLEQAKRKLQELQAAPEQPEPTFSKQQLETTTTDEQILDYKNRLLEPEHHVYFMRALRSLSERVVTDIFKSFFRKEPAKGVILLNAQLRKIADARGHQVLEAIDRIRQHKPKLLERYADFWIDVNKDTLEKLHLGEKVKDDVDNAILDIALFLVQPSDNTNAQVLTERLAIQSQQIIALEQQIQTEQEQNEKREQELIQTKRKLEQAQDTNEKRLLQMQAQLEHKFEENLEQSLKIEGEKRLEELKKLNTEMTHLQEKSLQEQQELEFFKRQLDEATDELETQHEQTHVDFKLMQRTNERISADLLEKTRVLSVSETARQQLLKRTNELTQALEKVKLEQKTLAEDHVEREREQQKNLGGTKLENALIIDYRHLSSEPAERLVMLLQIYNAFLEHRKDFQPMVDHTNYADFADPKKEIRGLLLLGLEMLLLDGVNLPLIQWLNTQAFRQESVLKQLLGVLESPRLRGMT
jgi:hypothetical protein